MSTTNGTKPKLDLLTGQSLRVKLQRNSPITGSNSYGNYYLYPLIDEEGHEQSFFAPEEIHNLIQQHKLKAGDEFVLSRVEGDKKGKSRLEFSIIGKAELQHNSLPSSPKDNLKAILLECVVDAADVIRSSGIQFGNDELQKLATTLFIQRSRNA